MALGIDEDWAKVNPAAAVGYDFIVGYESEDTTGKNLTIPDINAIHAARKDVGIVYEFNPQSALLGASEGHRTASIAISHARAVGCPLGVCLYNASFDFNVLSSQFAVCDEFLSAYVGDVRSAGFRAGPYAGYGYIQHAGSLRLADFYWQTYGWSLDANGLVQWSPYAVLHQYANGVNVAGVTVDLDQSEAVQWGQWAWNGDYGMTVLLTIVKPDGTAFSGPTDGLGNFHWIRDAAALQEYQNATGQVIRTVSSDLALRAYGVNVDALTTPPAGQPSIDYSALAAAILTDPNFPTAVAGALVGGLTAHPLVPKV